MAILYFHLVLFMLKLAVILIILTFKHLLLYYNILIIQLIWKEALVANFVI